MLYREFIQQSLYHPVSRQGRSVATSSRWWQHNSPPTPCLLNPCKALNLTTAGATVDWSPPPPPPPPPQTPPHRSVATSTARPPRCGACRSRSTSAASSTRPTIACSWRAPTSSCRCGGACWACLTQSWRCCAVAAGAAASAPTHHKRRPPTNTPTPPPLHAG
jgi:hypothetical protein